MYFLFFQLSALIKFTHYLIYWESNVENSSGIYSLCLPILDETSDSQVSQNLSKEKVHFRSPNNMFLPDASFVFKLLMSFLLFPQSVSLSCMFPAQEVKAVCYLCWYAKKWMKTLWGPFHSQGNFCVEAKVKHSPSWWTF